MDRTRNATRCPPGAPAPCWQFDQKKFPSGGKAIVDYIHAKGLLVGVYSSAGPKTCQGCPASLGREADDAKWIEAMGIDYLKYDNCGSEGISEAEQKGRFSAMGSALLKAAKPIFFSLCEWNGHTGNPFTWVRTFAGWCLGECPYPSSPLTDSSDRCCHRCCCCCCCHRCCC